MFLFGRRLLIVFVLVDLRMMLKGLDRVSCDVVFLCMFLVFLML